MWRHHDRDLKPSPASQFIYGSYQFLVAGSNQSKVGIFGTKSRIETVRQLLDSDDWKNSLVERPENISVS